MARIPFRPCRPSPSGRLAWRDIPAAGLHTPLRRRLLPSLFADWIEQLFAEGITAGCR